MPACATWGSWVLDVQRGPQRRQWQAGAVGCIAAMLLPGCSSTAPTAPTGPGTPPPTAEQRAVAPAALNTERQWLQSWFKDTPVRIAQRGEAAITVDVPLEFCFDAGRSTIKPALAAVLDKVAESMRRVPAMRLPMVAAPDGAAGTAPLATQRAAQVHKHLLNRGVAAARLGPPSSTPVAAVQLRLEAVPPA